MTTIRAIALTACAAFAIPAAAQSPSPEAVVDGMIRAAGGAKAFESLGVLHLPAEQFETLSDGSTRNSSFEAWVDTAALRSLRLQLNPQVVLGKYGDGAWALVNNELDDRPQAPKMAHGSMNQKLFPLLLPWTLRMPGVVIGTVDEGMVEGQQTWRLAISFEQGFFTAPSMLTTWHVHASQEDMSFVAAEYLPPISYRKVVDEGVRYRVLQHRTVSGAEIPSQVLLDGIDFGYRPNGHIRVTKMQPSRHGPFDLELFMNPAQFEALEAGDVPLD